MSIWTLTQILIESGHQALRYCQYYVQPAAPDCGKEMMLDGNISRVGSWHCRVVCMFNVFNILSNSTL